MLEHIKKHIFETPNQNACNIDLIDYLQTKYDIFGKYSNFIKETAISINANKTQSNWVKFMSNFAINKGPDLASKIPLPPVNPSNMMLFYVLLPQIPLSIEKYTQRGFSDDEISELLGVYKNSIEKVESQTGLPGMDGVQYRWLMRFCKAVIFKTDGLFFELRQVPNVVTLKNNCSQEIVPILPGKVMHTSGIQPVGSQGFDDDTDAFLVVFYEDEDNYYGNGTYNGVVQRETQVYSKKEWTCIVRPGDDCLSLHIPQHANLSPHIIDKAFQNAKKISLERFPEFQSTLIYCSSWLLDPTIPKLLGSNSNISNLQHYFIKYPQKCDGTRAIKYVFPNHTDLNITAFPEKTSLQKKMKKLYLSGKCIYVYSGIAV